jgi:hypothetical protein
MKGKQYEYDKIKMKWGTLLQKNGGAISPALNRDQKNNCVI